ncbi:hypothetical protein GYB59_03550 [bacterium]|nr:hypothetical protein [bacterium]
MFAGIKLGAESSHAICHKQAVFERLNFVARLLDFQVLLLRYIDLAVCSRGFNVDGNNQPVESIMLGIVSPYINLADDWQVRENFLAFQKEMSEFPLFTVEFCCAGTFETDSFLRVQGTLRQRMFQPERLINMLVRRLPAEIDAVAWIDPRIVLLNPSWYDQAKHALKRSRIVQLMSNVRWLDHSGLLEPALQSRVPSFGTLSLQAGAAWAMRRETFEHLGGVFAWDIAGNGNAWLQNALAGEISNRFLQLASVGMYKEFLTYAQRCRQVFQSQVHVLPGDALQRFQGNGRERLFWLRHEWLNRAGYTPREDLHESQDGLLEWATNRSFFEEHYRSVMELPTLP